MKKELSSRSWKEMIKTTTTKMTSILSWNQMVKTNTIKKGCHHHHIKKLSKWSRWKKGFNTTTKKKWSKSLDDIQRLPKPLWKWSPDHQVKVFHHLHYYHYKYLIPKAMILTDHHQDLPYSILNSFEHGGRRLSDKAGSWPDQYFPWVKQIQRATYMVPWRNLPW